MFRMSPLAGFGWGHQEEERPPAKFISARFISPVPGETHVRPNLPASFSNLWVLLCRGTIYPRSEKGIRITNLPKRLVQRLFTKPNAKLAVLTSFLALHARY